MSELEKAELSFRIVEKVLQITDKELGIKQMEKIAKEVDMLLKPYLKKS